jgi:hypothetical protein
MSSNPDFRDEYIPFSWNCFKAELNFHDGNYETALEKVKEMKEMVEQKIEE